MAYCISMQSLFSDGLVLRHYIPIIIMHIITLHYIIIMFKDKS